MPVPPDVQHQLIADLLHTCRQAPGALPAVVPYLEGGAAALMRALRRKGGDGPAGGMMPVLALPLVLEESLTVTQVRKGARCPPLLFYPFFGGEGG